MIRTISSFSNDNAPMNEFAVIMLDVSSSNNYGSHWTTDKDTQAMTVQVKPILLDTRRINT